MRIMVGSKRRGAEALREEAPEAIILDLTSRAELPWVRFSPFFPHGEIPVPFSGGWMSRSVEGIWQGLKVFETQGVDVSKFDVTGMRGIKRTSRKLGKILGHRKGVDGEELFGYVEARLAIYIPSYEYMLDHCLVSELKELAELARRFPVILLDYSTNCDPSDSSAPLSHASLVARRVQSILSGKKE